MATELDQAAYISVFDDLFRWPFVLDYPRLHEGCSWRLLFEIVLATERASGSNLSLQRTANWALAPREQPRTL